MNNHREFRGLKKNERPESGSVEIKHGNGDLEKAERFKNYCYACGDWDSNF